MQGPLCGCPLCLSLFFTVVFLGSEGSLLILSQKQNESENPEQNYKYTTIKIRLAYAVYLVLQKSIPSLSTEDVADSELEYVKRKICYQTVKPDYPGPAPATTLYPCKTPICIDRYESCYLSIGK